MNSAMTSVRLIPLNVTGHKHRATADTRQLLMEAGGLPVLLRFTTLFYQRSFDDPHLDKFIRSHHEPHHERFAFWIAEKLGDGTPWSNERRTRLGPVHDRSSAHYAAWHSPKREKHKFGDHFKPDDARVWMRVHFWAARETGLFEHSAFMDYYIRFIGHFVSVYSSKSPPFTRESARWSADPQNVQRYLDAGCLMADVINKPVERELAKLPAEERAYTGSGYTNSAWPYE